MCSVLIHTALTCCLHLFREQPKARRSLTQTSFALCFTSCLWYDCINDLCCMWQRNDITALGVSVCWCLCTLALTGCVWLGPCMWKSAFIFPSNMINTILSHQHMPDRSVFFLLLLLSPVCRCVYKCLQMLFHKVVIWSFKSNSRDTCLSGLCPAYQSSTYSIKWKKQQWCTTLNIYKTLKNNVT